MRALFLIGLLAAPARADADAAARALAAVRAQEAEMRAAQADRERAQQTKSDAAKRAMQANQNLNDLPGWRIISRAIAEDKANDAKSRFLAAREKAQAADGAYLEQGMDYVRAENDYRKATGGFYNEQQYNHVKDEIHFVQQEQAQSRAQDGSPDPERAQREAADFQKAIASGKPMSVGEMTARGQHLGTVGDDLLAQAMDIRYTPDAKPGATGGGGGLPGSTGQAAAGSAAYGRAAPPPDAVRMDKAILLSSPVSGPGQAGANPAARRYLSAGTERLSAGDPRGALAAAEAALKEDPRNAKAWALKAGALNAMRRFGEAEEAARRAVALDRSDPQAYRQLAWAQLHNGKADEAEASATRMIFLDPENPEGYLLRAFAYEMKGDRAKMLADLERAAALDPRYRNHLLRAQAGLTLFDPSSEETDSLLNALAPPPARRSNAATWLGLVLLALAGAAKLGPALAARLSRRRSAVGPPRPAAGPSPASAPAAPAPVPDGLLAGKYELRRIAGRGGMGQVWEAVDTTLHRRVAVKEMSPELAREPMVRELYLKEARTIAGVRHPNIVEIYEILDHPPDLHLVFEWVDGKTVSQVLVEKRVLPFETARAVLAPVCEALAFAHERGIVHRDLKPANVMVSADGHVKLMDFGIARALGERAEPSPAAPAPAAAPAAAVARTRTIAGTPGYRPPDAEIGVVTPGFDVYCVGVCLYEMLTGELPFGPQGWSPERTSFVPLSKKVPGLPRALDDIMERVLEPDPSKRLGDARALKAALLKV